MQKKRKHFPRKPSSKRHIVEHGKKSFRVEKSLERDVLTYLYGNEQAVSQADMVADLKLDRGGQKELAVLLANLVEEKVLHHTSKNRFSLGKQCNLVAGVLEQNPRGFGFVTGVMAKKDGSSYSKDPSVEATHMGAARHGDTVLIRVFRIRQDGRPEAEVISVLKRGSDRLAGFVSFEQNRIRVTPEDPRFP